MIRGAAVELSDQLASRSEHDRIQSDGSVRNPSREHIIRDLDDITDTTMIEIEAECPEIAVPQGERGLCFSRVGETVQLGELQGAMKVLDVTEDAAGTDRGKLLIITNQPNTPPRSTANCTAVSREKVSPMPASSMMINVAGPTPAAQSGRSP
jgi:hypothetical protein